MKYLIFIMLFISIVPMVCAETTIATMDGYWTLTGEITNTNPYTVFIAVPDEINYYNKSLKSSDNFLKVNLTDNNVNTTNAVGFYSTVLNGKKGFWIPPYTTVKIKINGIMDYSLNIDEKQDNYDVSGPALVDKTKILDLKQLFPAYKKGIKLDRFRLYVRGSIKKSDNTDVVSLIVPAPLVLKDYCRFNKILGKYDTDVWVDSYNAYINNHKKLSSKKPNLDVFDDALVPNMEDDLGMDVHLKLFDVPAMTFTTSSSKDIDYAYAMYWD